MTMKLEIYSAFTAVPTVPVLLQLRADPWGSIELVVVESNGDVRDQGHILKISNNGTIYMNRGVNSDFGFDLNDVDQVKVII